MPLGYLYQPQLVFRNVVLVQHLRNVILQTSFGTVLSMHLIHTNQIIFLSTLALNFRSNGNNDYSDERI